MKNTNRIFLLATIFFYFFSIQCAGQMITGVWKGKINKQKAEVKIVLNGDQLTGTSYYYETPDVYRRYSINGYFDPETNEAVWWDDELVEEKNGRSARQTPGSIPFLSRADFNCPGDGRMMLDGKAGNKNNTTPSGDLHLDKTEYGIFNDEWDYIIDNYLVGTNDPDLIDSIAGLRPVPLQQQPPATTAPSPIAVVTTEKPLEKKEPDQKKLTPVFIPAPPGQQTIEEKFVARKKVFVTEIPVSGDSIELRFYDNAEIDGDSISLFLNDKLIFEHVRLLASAYTIKLAVNDLNDTNELTMVAENLGSIPPNTSYMVAEVDGKRYEALLASTEGSSAMIRLMKKKTDH